MPTGPRARPQGRRTDSDGIRRRALLGSLALVLSATAGLVFVVFGRSLLPDRFLGDGQLIQLIAQERVSLVHDASYRHVAKVYATLGMADRPGLASLLGYVVMVATTMFALRSRLTALRHLHILMVTMACFALGAVFLGWYNKDFLVLPLSAAVVLQMQRAHPHRGWFWTLIPMVTYAILLRPYWMVIAAAFAAFYLVIRVRPAITPAGWLIQLFLLSQAALLALAIGIPLLLGEPADFARESANQHRLGSGDAESAIVRYIGASGTWATYFNFALVSIALVLPWPLLLTGNSVHLAYAVFIGAVWIGLGQSVRRDGTHLPPGDREAARIGLCFVAAILTVQTVFEPDYGSYLRHLTPVLPVILCLLAALKSPSGRRPARSAGGEAYDSTRVESPEDGAVRLPSHAQEGPRVPALLRDEFRRPGSPVGDSPPRATRHRCGGGDVPRRQS